MSLYTKATLHALEFDSHNQHFCHYTSESVNSLTLCCNASRRDHRAMPHRLWTNNLWGKCVMSLIKQRSSHVEAPKRLVRMGEAQINAPPNTRYGIAPLRYLKEPLQ